MGKTWVAVAAICLGAGTAAVHADGPGRRTLFGRELTFASDYQPSATTQTPAPPLAVPPAAAAPAAPAATAPAPQPVTAPVPQPVPASPTCAGCGGCAAPAGPTRFDCVNRLIDWGTYRPLHLGVKCAKCCNGLDEGGCCHYHCSQRLYLYFLDHCKDGPPPQPPAHTGCCNGCGTGGFWFPGQRLFLLRNGFGCGAVGCH